MDYTAFSFWCSRSLVKSCGGHCSEQRTNQVHSAKFEKAGIVPSLLDMTNRGYSKGFIIIFIIIIIIIIIITYKKYATRLSVVSVSGRIDSTSVLFPSKALLSI